MSRNIGLVFVLSVALVFAFGCAKKQVKQTDIDAAEEATEQAVVEEPEAVEPTPEPTPEPVAPKERGYRVVKEDNLWDISGMESVLGDPWLWPLVYKANHAEIDDPDLIYVDQEFTIPKGATASEMSAATEDAKNTPRYRRHSEPRKTLPLDYLD